MTIEPSTVINIVLGAIMSIMGFFLVRLVRQVDEQGKKLAEVDKNHVTRVELNGKLDKIFDLLRTLERGIGQLAVSQAAHTHGDNQ